MTRDDVERLVRVEERLQVVADGLDEHREESDRKHERLLEAIASLGGKLDERAFKWGAIFNRDNAKLLAYVISALGAGGAVGSVAKALLGE